MKKSELQIQYDALLKKLDIKVEDVNNIYSIVQTLIKNFMNSHKRVAVYCYGNHTRRLMSDFVFELKNIVAIIDNGMLDSEIAGFKIIKNEDIQGFNIDGVIVSSYIHREVIKDILRKNHPKIDVLDIYDGLENLGCKHIGTYYANSPMMVYKFINSKKRSLASLSKSDKQDVLCDIIKIFISIKDFRMALETAKDLSESDYSNSIICDIKSCYERELEVASKIGVDNVLLLCMDGLRRCDLSEPGMCKVWKYLSGNACLLKNAYSFSTSTFESLVPAFSENSDQRTEYYTATSVPSENCRFMREALLQNRTVCIYGDSYNYIDDDRIKYSGNSQTITEKIWDFLIDAENESNGLFYLHELYESHYSFSNPYTDDDLIADGTAMLFDFLPFMGGKLRCDYEKQHSDSIRYLDDTLFPFLSRLKCRTLMFADHGNMVLKSGTTLETVPSCELVAAEDWIRIPMAVVSPECPVGTNNSLMSLMDINELVLSLLQKRRIRFNEKRSYIKIGRSELYNPNFKYLYSRLGQERFLSAFEGFIFDSRYKLIVFSDGSVELYSSDDDSLLDMDAKKKELLEKVKSEITVCEL